MVRVSLILLLLASCSSPGITNKTGYTVDLKPYRGTTCQNKSYTRPYWQCVYNNMNVDCEE